MEKLKPFLPFFLALFISGFIIYFLFPSVHPNGGISLPLDANAIMEQSRTYLKDLGIDNAGMSVTAQLRSNHVLVREVQRRHGIERSNALLRDSLPGYYWEVRWAKLRSLNFSMGQSSEAKAAEQVAEYLRGEVHFQFDTRGKVFEFERKVPDSLLLASISVEEAKSMASSFLRRFTLIGSFIGDTSTITSAKKIEQPRRIDHEFVWSSTSPVLHNVVKTTVNVAGDRISKFSIDEKFPKEPGGVNAQAIVETGLVLVYLTIGIAMVVVAFRRFRTYEIGFRLAIFAGVVAGILFDIETYLGMKGEVGWQVVLSLVLAPVFVGGALIIVWAVSESVVRETWREKFISLDLLSRGHIVHSRIGSNVVFGTIAGIAAFAVWLVLVKAGDSSLGLWMSQSSDKSFHAFDTPVPSLYILSHSLYSNVFLFAVFVLFLVSLLRKYIASPWLLVLSSSVIMALLNLGHVSPIPVGLVIQAFVAAVSIWVFYRYDALAALVSLASYYVIQETAGLISVGNPVYASSGFFMLGLFVFVLASSVAMLYRKKEITDFDDIVPAFVRHISERQRMQQELKIARAVQMSFLPKANPVTSTLDIASRCAPALEVGGDYYDFIRLADHRLGVAVGDVSGKGTQAAFFMTLTKGFLNALAHVSSSPSQILTQVNKLFYENVERGMFISMVYGIFDTHQHTLTLARAGHNPVIMRKSRATEVQVVNPMGLALGLDQGETFSKSIQEVTINFQSGDLFVFYTDGFPEAMNKTMEEFGEERLCKTVEKYSHGTAGEIMDGVFVDMKQFTGKAKQHDDMTIVVVKVF